MPSLRTEKKSLEKLMAINRFVQMRYQSFVWCDGPAIHLTKATYFEGPDFDPRRSASRVPWINGQYSGTQDALTRPFWFLNNHNNNCSRLELDWSSHQPVDYRMPANLTAQSWGYKLRVLAESSFFLWGAALPCTHWGPPHRPDSLRLEWMTNCFHVPNWVQVLSR